MKDLSKEERLEQRVLELKRKIYEKDYAFDKEQGKRIKRTFFVLCGVIYILLLCLVLSSDINISGTNINTMNAKEIIENIFYAVVVLTVGVGFVAGLIMFISYGVWFYIMNGALKRAETIAKLEGELNAIEFYKYE